jgi:hypothetical protein
VSEPHTTPQDYEPAERDIAWERARLGVIVHSVVTLVVSVLLIALNVVLAPELIWWPFPVIGMLLGLLAHWWYGYERLEGQLRHQEQPTEDPTTPDC